VPVYIRPVRAGETALGLAAPYTGMDLNWADAIDSACTGCGGDAVDWVQVHDGTRRYACAECLEDLVRYRDDLTVADLPETPNAVVCPACERITLEQDAGPANRCPDCGGPEVEDALLEAVAEAQDEG